MGPGFSPLKNRRLLLIIFLFLIFSISIPLIVFLFQDQIEQKIFGRIAYVPAVSAVPKLTSTVNKKTGQGEFTITEPTPVQETPAPLQKQIIAEGNYYKSSQKIEVKASADSSNSPVSPSLLLSSMSKTVAGRVLIQLEMIAKGKTLYATVLPFASAVSKDALPFKVVLPYYYKDFSLRFSDVSDKTLLSKDIRL